MGWLLGSRSRGRHALGAAVTSIPSAPAESWTPVPYAAPTAVAYAVSTPASPSYAPLPPAPAPVVPVQQVPEPASGPRVQLTFRDGSSAALDADQARALDAIAQLLTGRVGVKH